MKAYTPWLTKLRGIETDISADLMQKYHIACVTGEWLDSAALKLQKSSWTDGGPGQGVFFSVWLGDNEIRKNRFHYNIHALKLRLLKGHTISSREFASAFRTKLAPQAASWPNLRTNYGPQTLMQGWMPLDPVTFHDDVVRLVEGFVAIHKFLDELLEERRKS